MTHDIILERKLCKNEFTIVTSKITYFANRTSHLQQVYSVHVYVIAAANIDGANTLDWKSIHAEPTKQEATILRG